MITWRGHSHRTREKSVRELHTVKRKVPHASLVLARVLLDDLLLRRRFVD